MQMEYGLWNLPTGFWQAGSQPNMPLEPRPYYAPGNGMPPAVFHGEPHYPGSTSYRHQTEYLATKNEAGVRPMVSPHQDEKGHMEGGMMPGEGMEPRRMENMPCDSTPMHVAHSPEEHKVDAETLKSSPVYGVREGPGTKTDPTIDYLKQQGFQHPMYGMLFTQLAATVNTNKVEVSSDGEPEDGNSQVSEPVGKIDYNGGDHHDPVRSPGSSIEPTSRSGYECGECGLVADTRPALKKHIMLSHPDPHLSEELVRKIQSVPNCCPMVTCGFRTEERNEMEAHVARHVSEGFNPNGKKKLCPVTLQRVRYSYEREEYRCQMCSYSCTIEKAFFKHLKVHTMGVHVAPIKISCVICGKDRASEVDMNKHMKRHRDDRYFCCDICIFKTVQLKKLIQHRRMHTGEKPHLCPHCSYRSARRDNLRSHVRRVHKKENLYCDTFTPRGLLVSPSVPPAAHSPSPSSHQD